MAFSPVEAVVAQGLADGMVRLWDITTRTELARVAHPAPITAVAFSADGRYLGSVGNGGTARVWTWRPSDLVEEACSRLRNLDEQGRWQRYLAEERCRHSCTSLALRGTVSDAPR